MDKLLKLASIIIAYFAVLLIFPINKVLAADFSVNYNIVYTLNSTGEATVDYNIKLTNLNSKVYASDYTLATGHKDVYAVKSFSSDGIVYPTKVVTDQNSSSITTALSQPVYGLNNSINWTIEYKTKEVASHTGNLWNIVIPGVLKKDIISNVAITVKTPTDFGPLNYVSATGPNISNDGNYNVFAFSKDSDIQTGILITLGDHQNYNFQYNYVLNNTSYTDSQSYEITIPPDLSSQNIYFTKISPSPSSVVKDKDNNYVVTFIVPPRTNETADVEGTAEVFSTPNKLSTPLSNPQDLSQSDLRLYTNSQPYWEVSNSKILALSQKITAGLSGDVPKAQAIFNYVVQTLHYNQDQVYAKNRDRFGALKALSDPNDAICQEYVDLFVTLARAAGIPSRMIAGYAEPAITSIQQLPPNVLHAWAQFYDPAYGWIDVDPTWQSTSGGLNYFGNVGSSHFALAVYGQYSNNPPLVLAFTSTQDTNKSIVIKNTTISPTPVSNISLSYSQNAAISGFGGNMEIGVENKGNTVAYISSVDSSAQSGLTLSKAQFNSNQPLLPGFKYNISIPYSTKDFLYSGTKEVSLSVSLNSNGQIIKKVQNFYILFSPLALLQYIPWIVTIIIFVISLTLVNVFIRVRRVNANK